jgi:hypothetical protein
MIDHLSLKDWAAAKLAGAHTQTGIKAMAIIPEGTRMNGLMHKCKNK